LRRDPDDAVAVCRGQTAGLRAEQDNAEHADRNIEPGAGQKSKSRYTPHGGSSSLGVDFRNAWHSQPFPNDACIRAPGGADRPANARKWN
jgi:hypothetical protein